MTRSLVRIVARGLVGVLLLAQMAIAAYACPGVSLVLQENMQKPATSTPMADPGDASLATTTTRPSNCDDMGGTMDPSFPNLCAEHCKYGQQSDQASTLNVPAAVLVALYATPLVPQPAPPPRPAAATMSALVAASPPHTIAHCVFRI